MRETNSGTGSAKIRILLNFIQIPRTMLTYDEPLIPLENIIIDRVDSPDTKTEEVRPERVQAGTHRSAQVANVVKFAKRQWQEGRHVPRERWQG